MSPGEFIILGEVLFLQGFLYAKEERFGTAILFGFIGIGSVIWGFTKWLA